MKKVLSLIMAIMMIFGSLAVNASAVSINLEPEKTWSIGSFAENQTVIIFQFYTGKSVNALPVFDGFKFVSTTGVTGEYIMLPQSSTDMVAGKSYVMMPDVTAPSGSKFKYWEVETQYSNDGYNTIVAADSWYKIPENAAGNTITFKAWYGSAEPEEDTLGSILGILTKVFGAIIGILMYGGDTEAGVAMMDKILGGLDL